MAGRCPPVDGRDFQKGRGDGMLVVWRVWRCFSEGCLGRVVSLWRSWHAVRKMTFMANHVLSE
jgi:hypothetical protein